MSVRPLKFQGRPSAAGCLLPFLLPWNKRAEASLYSWLLACVALAGSLVNSHPGQMPYWCLRIFQNCFKLEVLSCFENTQIMCEKFTDLCAVNDLLLRLDTVEHVLYACWCHCNSGCCNIRAITKKYMVFQVMRIKIFDNIVWYSGRKVCRCDRHEGAESSSIIKAWIRHFSGRFG